MKTGFLKSEEFLSQVQRSGKTPLARLKGLSNILNQWNQSRIGSVIKGDEADLSINDVNVLKGLVHDEINKLKLPDADTVSDQILFLLIGAIKMQIQSNSAQPWALVNQSIKDFVRPKRFTINLFMMLSLLTIVALCSFTAIQLSITKKQNTDFLSEESLTAFNEVGSNTVNNLITIYNKMKEGDCQLPQVAMLQPQEREAYILFINDGKVDINTANDLKNALSHVSCLYPQKLMNKPNLD